jgi:hypothetical protein
MKIIIKEQQDSLMEEKRWNKGSSYQKLSKVRKEKIKNKQGKRLNVIYKLFYRTNSVQERRFTSQIRRFIQVRRSNWKTAHLSFKNMFKDHCLSQCENLISGCGHSSPKILNFISSNQVISDLQPNSIQLISR